MDLFRSACCLAVLMGAAPALAAEGRQPLSATYTLTVGGVTLGEAQLSGSAGHSAYDANINVRLVGIASLFSSGRGEVKATGLFAGNRTHPLHFTVATTGGKEPTSVDMRLSGGKVAALAVSPERQVDPEKIPVTAAHKRGVIDPVSAGIVPVPGHGPVVQAKACQRTAPVYDGNTRFNLVFSYVRTEEIAVPGYNGQALVCNIRYVPVAGHHPTRQEEITARGAVSQITLVPVGGQRFLIPAKIVVPTRWGEGVLAATRVDVGAQKQAGLTQD